jgi:hypothetical protein
MRVWVAAVVLGVIGVALRIAAMLGFRPGFIANPDAFAYLDAAGTGLFDYPERPAGYPAFLRVADFLLLGELPLLIAVQHGLGLATAVLVYLAMRRFGASQWVALVPAAVVLLSGDQIFFEHAVLSEALFGFLLAAVVYCSARAIDGNAAAWGAAAAALLGAASTVRTVALFMLPLLLVWLLFVAGPGTRMRLLAAAAAAVAGLSVVGVYVIGQREATDFTGLSRTSGWSLYSRVAYFANCREFEPPKGTEALCEDPNTAGERAGSSFYHHNAASPAWRLFGPPPQGDDQLGAFGRTVVVNQPVAYMRAVATDLVRYVVPSVGEGRTGSGTTPLGLTFSDPNPIYLGNAEGAVEAHWGPVEVSTPLANELRAYHRVVYVHAPLVAILFLVALAGLWAAPRVQRLAIALMLSLTAMAVLLPSATLIYNWRYLVPMMPLLVGAAALGAQELVVRRRRA